jgi:hypothetical protein
VVCVVVVVVVAVLGRSKTTGNRIDASTNTHLTHLPTTTTVSHPKNKNARHPNSLLCSPFHIFPFRGWTKSRPFELLCSPFQKFSLELLCSQFQNFRARLNKAQTS